MLSFPPISFHKVCYSNGEYTIMLSNILFPLDLHTLRIISAVQPNGLAVPDASMHPVTSTSDVLELIGVGLKNRVVGATAMNERSSRSHRYLQSIFVLPPPPYYIISNLVVILISVCS